MSDIDSNLPVKDTSDGTPGSAVPSMAQQMGGTDGTNLRALSTDTTGKINVNNISGTVSLPTLAATSTKQSDGSQKTQVVDASGNVQPSGDVLTRKIFVQPTDGSNNQGYTASSEAKVSITQPIPAGTNIIGKVGIDQTTPGTTNGVQVNAALPTGTNSIGQVTANAGTNLNTSLLALQTGANTFLDKNNSDTITSLSDSVVITTNGCSTIYLSITGTWVAALTLQGDSGDGTWNAAVGILPFPSGALASTIGSNVSLIIPCGGYKQVRLIATGFTSGTATVTYNVGSGTNAVQVFNNLAASLQATARLNDGSGNAITSTAVAGAAASKQPLDVSIIAPAILYYSAPVEIHQSAATATAATVWAMRNAAASTRTVYIERIELSVDFAGTNPVTRSLIGYDLCRFSTATPTAGTAITVIEMDNSANPATQVTDVRFLDTGLTTTSVVFETAFATVAVGSSDGAVRRYSRQGISVKLAAGEGLCIRLTNTAVTGLNLSGEIVWSER